MRDREVTSSAQQQKHRTSLALYMESIQAYSLFTAEEEHDCAIQVRDGMRWFTRKARGGLELEDRLRRVVNRYRYRGATT